MRQYYDNDATNQNDNYEHYIMNELNLNSNEFIYNTDANDPIQSPSCDYSTVNQFKEQTMDNSDDFLFMHMNIRSLNKNFDNLKLLLDNPHNTPCSVIALTETWLSHNSSSNNDLPGFNLVVNSRQNKTGGGVCLYILKKYDYIIHEQLNIMNDTVESLFIEIIIPDSKNIFIGVIYRPPNSNINDFVLYLQGLLHDPVFINKDSYLAGDFNVDLMKCNSCNHSQDFIELFMSASFLPLISKPTRVTEQTATLIDNIFCNVFPLPESKIILSDISDHYPIFMHAPIKYSKKGQYFRRKITDDNLRRFQQSLNDTDWSYIYKTQDINLSFDYFMDIINLKLNDYIPIQKNTNDYKKTPRLPWISKSLLRSINRKNNLFYRYKSKPSERSKFKYVTYKNTLTKILRIEKKNYYTNQLNLYKHDIKGSSTHLQNIVGGLEKKCAHCHLK